ncbi:MAG TPA: DNA primase [Terriglobales bacterium]|jgi:DNA primase
MSTSTDFKETLKQQADIVRVVGDYVKLKKAGAQNFSGLCPFHSEKTPSFSVHATRQFYHCFGCGASGDVFSFVQKVENVGFPEAVRIVAQKMGVPLPRVVYSSPEEAREAKHRTALLEIHEQACGFFEDYLRRPEGAQAREYLAGRGLDGETIGQFHIGYAPDSGFVLRDRLRGAFAEEILRESGLFSWKSGEDSTTSPNRDPKADSREPKAESREPKALSMYSKFRNRVMFPIRNDSGRVIAFTGRTLSTDEKAGPKYLNSPETPIYSKSRVLFDLDQAKEAIRKLDYAILVEGQMDCISVYAAGFHNVIASSGTAFTDAQAKLLGRFSKNVIVNFDPDTAGARATERTLGLLVEEEFNIRVVTLEPGFDPDLFIRRKGKDAYAAALKGSQKYFDYLIERARGQFPVRSSEGKVRAVNYLLPHIQRVPSRIVRDGLAAEMAQKLGIDSAVLRQELKHVAATRSASAVKAPAEAQVTEAERILIRALASASEIRAGDEHLSARDGAEEDFDPARQAQFVLQNERLHEGLGTESLIEVLLNAPPETQDVMALAFSDADRRVLAATLMRGGDELTPELVEETIRALRHIRLERMVAAIQAEIVAAEAKRRSATTDEERVRQDMALAELGMKQHKLQMELGSVELADRERTAS